MWYLQKQGMWYLQKQGMWYLQKQVMWYLQKQGMWYLLLCIYNIYNALEIYILVLIIIIMPKNILSNNNHSQFSTAIGSLACSNLLPELMSLNSQKNTLVACKTSKRIKSRN